jgi:hypothetical protein
MSKTELCIMPESELYSTKRFEGSHRHEVFYGTSNRQKSIKYGLVVFLTPEMHNMSNEGVHFNKAFDNELKQIGQKAAMEKYDLSIEDFIKLFGKNYL